MTRWLWRLVVAAAAIGVLWSPGVWLLPVIFVGSIVVIGILVAGLALATPAHRDAWARNHE